MDTPSGSSVPFEDRSLPFGTRFLETAKASFADPVRMFSGMREGDITDPLLYGVIVGTVACVFGGIWQIFLGGLGSLAEGAGAEELVVGTGFILFFMIFSPLFAALGLLINAGIYHLMLLLVGDGQRGFSITMRAVCYAQTPALLGIVPICGGIIGGIWVLVLVILGAAYGHPTDGWRAVLAYFLPAIFCCGLIFVFASMFGFLSAVSG